MYNNKNMKLVAGILLLLPGTGVVFTAPVAAIEQVVQKGTTGVIHTGKGDINIGYSIEQHEKKLKEQEHSIRQELKILYESKSKNLKSETKTLSLEKQLLERKLADVTNQIQSLKDSYQKQIAFLESTITELRALDDAGNDSQVAAAITALQQGDTAKADQLFKHIEEKEKTSIERAAKAAFERGKIAQNNIDYRNAYQHYERAVGLAPNNPEYLEYAGAIAGKVANHPKELEWVEKALAIYLNQPDAAADVARLRNRLGSAWHDLGEYKKAIEYYELALASGLKTYGEDHPDVATSRNNLGLAWYALGQYKKAIEYYELALASGLKTYGEGHPAVASVRSNLGEAWRALGQYEEAIEYYELALASGLKTYGADHPAVAIRRNNLGTAWRALDQHEKAIGYYELALASDLKTYGEDHPTVATRRNNLGVAWNSLGQYKKAIGYFELALASGLKTYGEDHPAVATHRNNLGGAWDELGQYEKAIGYYELALPTLEKVLGVDHPTTKTVAKNLASARAAQLGGVNEPDSRILR